LPTARQTPRCQVPRCLVSSGAQLLWFTTSRRDGSRPLLQFTVLPYRRSLCTAPPLVGLRCCWTKRPDWRLDLRQRHSALSCQYAECVKKFSHVFSVFLQVRGTYFLACADMLCAPSIGHGSVWLDFLNDIRHFKDCRPVNFPTRRAGECAIYLL